MTHWRGRGEGNNWGEDPRFERMEGKKVIVGVTGGIAAYKAAEIASKLTQAGARGPYQSGHDRQCHKVRYSPDV